MLVKKRNERTHLFAVRQHGIIDTGAAMTAMEVRGVS